MSDFAGVDAFAPAQVAARVETLGITKARAPLLTLFVLAVLAGAFISMGALFYIFAITDSPLGFGPSRVFGGVVFSLGLILVIIAGAELFTGNNLIVMAWASARVSTRDLLKNWIIVYFGNVTGAVGTALIMAETGIDRIGGGLPGQMAMSIQQAKCELSFIEVLLRGIFCNALVCMAVWLSMAGRTVIDKVVVIVPPVAAFVALGFEHSIANWFFLPYGARLAGTPLADFFAPAAINLIASTLGNIIGGSILVAGIYWLAYLRDRSQISGGAQGIRSSE